MIFTSAKPLPNHWDGYSQQDDQMAGVAQGGGEARTLRTGAGGKWSNRARNILAAPWQVTCRVTSSLAISGLGAHRRERQT